MPPPAQQLCLSCGLCCNGVLFKDVELGSADNPRALQTSGLQLEHLKSRVRFAQPCSALCANNHCRIYRQRPARCRQFDCQVLKKVTAGTISHAAGLRTIARTLQRAERVRQLLRRLGDAGEHLPLSKRFRLTRRRMEAMELDDSTAQTFADLTLAVHELNVAMADFL